MTLKQIINKKTSKPCKTCLVRPTCNIACNELLEVYKKRGHRFRIFSGVFPPGIALSSGATGVSFILTKQFPQIDQTIVVLSVALIFGVIGVLVQNLIMNKRFETIDILETLYKSQFKGLR